MHPALAAAASATRIATAPFSRRRGRAAWPRCWPRRAAPWPGAIPETPRRPGAQALAADPDEAEALFHLGNLERERGHHDLAVAHYRRALVRAPGHAGVLNNLGLTYEAQGETALAEACYRDVLAATPDHPDALANLANIQFGREDFAAAAETYRRALAGRRDFPASFWTQRAIALHAIGASATPNRACAKRRGLCRTWSRSTSTSARSACDKASSTTRRLRSSACWNSIPTIATRARCRSTAASSVAPGTVWTIALPRCAGSSNAKRAPGAGDAAVPFPLLAMPLPPRLLAARGEGDWSAQQAHRARPRPAFADQTHRRLRLGFVSADFRDHPTTHLLIDCWERLDRSRIETFAYSLLAAEQSALGARVSSMPSIIFPSVEHDDGGGRSRGASATTASTS